MVDETRKRGPSDPADYSSTLAPATRKYAEGRRPHPSDDKLEPGGPLGADENPGIGSLDRDNTVSGGRSTGQQDVGATEDRDPT